MKRYFKAIIALCLALSVMKAQDFNQEFISFTPDVKSVLTSVGAAGMLSEHTFFVNYRAYQASFPGGKVYSGAIAGVLALPFGNLQTQFQSYQTGLFGKQRFSLGFSRPFLNGRLCAGAALIYYRHAVDKSSFKYVYGDNPQDPVFAGGDSHGALGFDLGANYRLSDRFNLSVCTINLTRPDLSFSGDTPALEDRHLIGGVSWAAWRNYGVIAEVDGFQTGDASLSIAPGIGITAVMLDSSLNLMAGHSRDNFKFSVFFQIPKLHIGLDYSALYPLSEINGESYGNHYFTFVFSLPRERAAEPPKSDNSISKKDIDRLTRGITIPFPPDAGDTLLFVYCVNNIAVIDTIVKSKLTSIEQASALYVVPEEKKDQYIGLYTMLSFSRDQVKCNKARPEIRIDLKNTTLIVEQLNSYYQEIPQIPYIFFDKDSSGVAEDRFNLFLDALSQRLMANRDARITLKGYNDYFTEAGQPELARKRAWRVREFLIAKGAPEDKIAISDAPDDSLYKTITGSMRRLSKEIEQLRAEEENRRVEIFGISPIEYAYNEALDKKDEIVELLKNNPDYNLVFTVPDTSLKSLRVVYGIKENYIEQMPENIKKRSFLSSRITDSIRVIIDPDGIIYRPRLGRTTLDIGSITDSVDIRINARLPLAVKYYRVTIEDVDGNLVRELSVGKDKIPGNLSWHWTDEDNRLADYRKKYYAHLEFIDAEDKTWHCASDTSMIIKITGSEKRQEEMMMVQFAFATDLTNISYFENRWEYVAKRLFQTAGENGDSIQLTIIGNTDDIGSDAYNLKLSESRAQNQMERLYQYMHVMLNHNQKESIDEWFKRMHITISGRGVGATSPFKLHGDELQVGKILGDNRKPEGRCMNRNVIFRINFIKTR